MLKSVTKNATTCFAISACAKEHDNLAHQAKTLPLKGGWASSMVAFSCFNAPKSVIWPPKELHRSAAVDFGLQAHQFTRRLHQMRQESAANAPTHNYTHVCMYISTCNFNLRCSCMHAIFFWLRQWTSKSHQRCTFLSATAAAADKIMFLCAHISTLNWIVCVLPYLLRCCLTSIAVFVLLTKDSFTRRNILRFLGYAPLQHALRHSLVDCKQRWVQNKFRVELRFFKNKLLGLKL
jgi:hypothetical protein